MSLPAPSSQPLALSEAPALAFGARDPHVKTLQKALKELGFFSHGCDGTFGPKTKDAVGRFQLAHGLLKSAEEKGYGVFGPKTKATLLSIVSLQPQPTAASPVIHAVTAHVARATKAVEHTSVDFDTVTQQIAELDAINTRWKDIFSVMHAVLSQQDHAQFVASLPTLPTFYTIDVQELANFAKNGFLANGYSSIKIGVAQFGKRYHPTTLQELTLQLRTIKTSLPASICSKLNEIFSGVYVTLDQESLTRFARDITSALRDLAGEGYSFEPAGDMDHIINIADHVAPMIQVIPYTPSEEPLLNSGFSLTSPHTDSSPALPPKFRIANI